MAQETIKRLSSPITAGQLTLSDGFGVSLYDFTTEPDAYREMIVFVHSQLAAMLRRFKVNGNMDPEEVTEMAILIVDTYRDFTPEDIVIFCKSVRAGFIVSPARRYEYAKPFGAVDEPLVMGWLRQYYEAKIDQRERTAQQRRQEAQAEFIPDLSSIAKSYLAFEEKAKEPKPEPKPITFEQRRDAILPGLVEMKRDECEDLAQHLADTGEIELSGFIRTFIKEKQWK